MSLKTLNSFGYDQVPTKILKLCSPFINSQLNYICNITLPTGVLPNRLKHGFIRPLLKTGNNNDIQLQANINLFFKNVWKSNAHWTAETSDHIISSNKQHGFRIKLETDNATYQ